MEFFNLIMETTNSRLELNGKEVGDVVDVGVEEGSLWVFTELNFDVFKVNYLYGIYRERDDRGNS